MITRPASSVSSWISRKVILESVLLASVFKLGRDKKKRNAVWYFEYQDHNGKKLMRNGFSDKSLANQMAMKLETEARLRHMGCVNEQQAQFAVQKKTPIIEHFDDYERSLSSRKNTAKHVKLLLTNQQCHRTTSDTQNQKRTPSDKDGVQWRRRELNPL